MANYALQWNEDGSVKKARQPRRSYPNGKVGCKSRTEAVCSQDTRAMSRGNLSKLPSGSTHNLKSVDQRKELAKLAHRYNYEYGGRSNIRVWRSE